ncbi:MAG: hypothetical protein KAW12_30345 [Candidatus Aminicenantes bacterium]|nr:hypothetical protein [Candidatus Aminicenantes bacterium]
MRKRIFFIIISVIVVLHTGISAKEDYLKIDTNVNPGKIKQGEEGVLSIKIVPKNGIKISTHPKFMIKLNPNDNLTFSKLFFTASELNFETKEENDTVFLDLEKENEISFKVNDSALIGRINISGEVVFTAVFKDNWSLKTHQPFNVNFFSRKNNKLKKK